MDGTEWSGSERREGTEGSGSDPTLPSGLGARVAYPRLAKWTVVGAALFLLSGVFSLLATAAGPLILLAFATKYLGASLFAMGGFFYALNWSIDYGPDFVRRLRS